VPLSSVTISKEGHKLSLHLDQKILKSLHEWKYQPAMCGNEPVVGDMMISIGIFKD